MKSLGPKHMPIRRSGLMLELEMTPSVANGLTIIESLPPVRLSTKKKELRHLVLLTIK